jgi:hypothetical protein
MVSIYCGLLRLCEPQPCCVTSFQGITCSLATIFGTYRTAHMQAFSLVHKLCRKCLGLAASVEWSGRSEGRQPRTLDQRTGRQDRGTNRGEREDLASQLQSVSKPETYANYSDLQGHPRPMRAGRLSLALPRCRAYTGHVFMRDDCEKSEVCEVRISRRYRICRAYLQASLVYRIFRFLSFIGASYLI